MKRYSGKSRVIRAVVRGTAVVVSSMFVLVNYAVPQTNWVSEHAVLPRGTTYEMRKPNTWNGTLIIDLDFAQTPDAPRYLWLLNNGYAISGTARRADRPTAYDPAHEIVDLINVMDLFAAKWGKPKRTIAYGQSGGGFDALVMAEHDPDRIDAALAACTHVPVWLKNSDLDLFFVLQKLIAPNLQITNIPQNTTALAAAWKKALTDAQQTPIGRARIALATTISQIPAWGTASAPEPDPNDVVALENSMFQTVLIYASTPGGVSRSMFEASAPGELSWNEGIDYSSSFSNGVPAYQKATQELYKSAGTSLESELAVLAKADRIKADPSAIKWWSYPGRTVSGEPKVPVLRFHTSGDPSVLPAIVQGYDAAVKTLGYDDLYRTAFVHAAGHCNFTTGEIAAGIQTLMQRLDNGDWGGTSPGDLNKLANQLDPGTGGHFIKYDQVKYNRAWFPTLKDYLGQFDPTPPRETRPRR